PAFPGEGHAADRRIGLGLLGYVPAELDVAAAERRLAELRRTKQLEPPGLPPLEFDPDCGIIFDFGPALPGHANGMVFEALADSGAVVLAETYYSIGGGFVVTAREREAPPAAAAEGQASCPYPFATAAAMLDMARRSGLSI